MLIGLMENKLWRHDVVKLVKEALLNICRIRIACWFDSLLYYTIYLPVYNNKYVCVNEWVGI